MTVKRCIRIFLLTLLTARLSACASSKPYQATVDMNMLQPHVPPSVPAGNVVTVVAFPIVQENIGEYGEISRRTRWREMNTVATGVNTIWTKTISLVPLPTFQIHIINQTGQPISLAETQIRVEDSARREYGLMVDYVAIKGRFIADMLGMAPSIANDRDLKEKLLREIHQIPLVSPAVTVQPGQTWIGYLVLNTDAHNPEEYRAMMASIDSFVVRFRNVPNGKTSKDFEFLLDRVVNKIQVTCPWDVKQPSLEACEPTQLATQKTELRGAR